MKTLLRTLFIAFGLLSAVTLAAFAQNAPVTVTINPTTNGGARAEVSVKGISGGIKMGHGPGAARDGDLPVDI